MKALRLLALCSFLGTLASEAVGQQWGPAPRACVASPPNYTARRYATPYPSVTPITNQYRPSTVCRANYSSWAPGYTASPYVAPAAYRAAPPVPATYYRTANVTPGWYRGDGLYGQDTVYANSQPVRNFFRYLLP